MKTTRLVLTLGAIALVTACRRESADAYGNFEATEVTVAAEASGRVLRLDADEGTRVEAHAVVGVIDTTALVLQRAELVARREAARARTREVDANAAALETQRDIAERELERTRRLLAAQAATAQQGDRAERDVRVLRDQLQGAGRRGARSGGKWRPSTPSWRRWRIGSGAAGSSRRARGRCWRSTWKPGNSCRWGRRCSRWRRSTR